MKVLHCSYSAYPDPPGGTEIYVSALCRVLDQQGVDNVVVAPGSRDESLEWNGLRIRKYAARPAHELEQLYGASDAETSARFARILDEERPDVVHQHALTPACSSDVARQAKARGLPVVFTYHTPTVTCQRGTLMEWGETPCDGHLTVARCTACSLHGLGLAGSASRFLAQVPEGGGRLLGSLGLSGGPWTALRMSSLVALRQRDVATLFDSVDRIVVLAPWVGEVLRVNGVPDHKLTVNAHGIEMPSDVVTKHSNDRGPLRIAHLGRMDPTKGTALLVEAVRAATDVAIELDVYGVVQHATGGALMDDIRRAAEGDRRIRFLPAVPHENVVATLATYDLVALPSQWMETGPLVALEAFAAGVPVIGSALGGIADKVRDGVDGILVRPHNAVSAWSQALVRCATDVGQVRRLRGGIKLPRSMREVATGMRELYEGLARSDAQRWVPEVTVVR